MKSSMKNRHRISLAIAALAAGGLLLTSCGGSSGSSAASNTPAPNAWMAETIVAEQAAAAGDTAKEAVANRRARLLIAAMTFDQKLQQLTGAVPEVIPELPQCKGGRHVSGIPALNIPTFRVTNGPVGLGQNDCVSTSVPPVMVDFGGSRVDISVYAHASSAKATALPSAIAAAASFDPSVAAAYGELIGTEMLDLALHEFEAPGMNLARLPILGRNFEYFGEDPYLAGTMSVAEIRSIQAKGLIAMAKHYLANEQETNRTTIQETVDRQVLRELYLLPFEMSVKDGKVASIMCAYNYLNGVSSCENKETLTDILRNDWGFTGYVQSDFYATKSTVGTMNAGMDFMMPTPLQWSPQALQAALAAGTITQAQIDKALERRYTQMFKYGIFERPLVQTPIDFAAHGKTARDIGGRAAVLLQNNGVLPFAASVQKVVVIGKATQVYAQQAVSNGALLGQPMGTGLGSSDVVPTYSVAPVAGLQDVLTALGNTTATVTLVTVKDDNSDLGAALAAAQAADAVIVMAGTIAEEGADRATFTSTAGTALATSAADGSSLDWYAARLNAIATTIATGNLARNSGTVAMIKAIQAAAPGKTALVLKDNAGVAMDPALVGAGGPAILEVWFPGQEDGHIVADLLFGVKNPAGKLPVTFPFVGQGFLDSLSAAQFPGTLAGDGVTSTVEYTEKLAIGYRWYDANNVAPAFPFGHGLSYTRFSVGGASLAVNGGKYDVKVTVTNTGSRSGAEVVQVYVTLPPGADSIGAKQPPRRLVGFKKVDLAAGAAQDVTITIDPAASSHPLSAWSTTYNQWITPKGNYTLWVGNSSRNVSALPFTR
ncbi:MAG: glycoside hydrolase family 3 C-terminal domain-containing protein [Proteobacteria bacterium]|nr:glycoside hydrolase family 3 C-terminal domain-containing protein [Pseudomonadota bacterium]